MVNWVVFFFGGGEGGGRCRGVSKKLGFHIFSDTLLGRRGIKMIPVTHTVLHDPSDIYTDRMQ